ncbi:MAG: alpha/beta hydrolase [Natronohydrobacter sp.]|nr:alpha/beta hydrolase [Natronohydrobacter sp.]
MKRISLTVLALLGIVASAAVICAAIGAFVDPTSSLFAVIGSMVWAPFGPFLFLATLAACLAGFMLRMMGMRRLGGLVLVLAVPGTIGAGFILTRIALAGVAAGAEINLPAVVMLGTMEEPAPDSVETVRSVEGTELRAAIYRPPSMATPAPVIVYIHGGGFMTGTPTETAADLRWFADNGWLVVSVEYRLFGTDSPTWDKAPDDVRCALAWTYRNATRFGGDPTRLAILGDSAGGNLAINAGFAAAAGGGKSICGADIAVPMAIAVQYPAVDPVSIYEDGFPIPGFAPRMLIEGYIGGSPDLYPERIAAVSSATFLTPDAPPTLVILPERDSLVVTSGTLAFVQDARAAGVDLELVRIPFANHVYNQLAANSLGNQIGRTVRLRFLEQHMR